MDSVIGCQTRQDLPCHQQNKQSARTDARHQKRRSNDDPRTHNACQKEPRRHIGDFAKRIASLARKNGHKHGRDEGYKEERDVAHDGRPHNACGLRDHRYVDRHHRAHQDRE